MFGRVDRLLMFGDHQYEASTPNAVPCDGTKNVAASRQHPLPASCLRVHP